MADIGPKAEIVLRFSERLFFAEEATIDGKKAKDKPNLGQKIDQTRYGKGDRLSTPERDKRAKEPTPPSEEIPGAITTGIQMAFDNGGLDGRMVFQHPKYAYQKVASILATLGLRPMEALEDDSFSADSTSASFPVAKNNTDCPVNPIPTNRNVKMAWVSTTPNQFSVTASIE